MSSLDPKPASDRNWPKDEFGHSEVVSQLWLVWGGIIFVIFLGLAAAFLPGLRSKSLQVIAYCAQDQVYAEPIFRAFEKETGIKVRAVYDSEAVKTVGLANRLLAERPHPQ